MIVTHVKVRYTNDTFVDKLTKFKVLVILYRSNIKT